MSISHLKCKDCSSFFEHRIFTSHDKIQCPECRSTNITEQLASVVDTHINLAEREFTYNNK